MTSDVFLNLHHLIAAAWRRRYTICLPVFIMPVIAVIIGMMTPKKFQNHTTLLVQEASRMNPFLEDFAVATQLKERMAALKALLHSRHVLSAVTRELSHEPEDSHTREYSHGQKQSPVQQDTPVDSQLTQSHENAIKRLSSRLSVVLIGSDLVKITYNDSEPSQMKRTLEIVTKHFLTKLLAPEKSSITASAEFLQNQLAKHHKELLAAENALSIFKSDNMSRLPDQYQFDIQSLREIERTREEKRIMLVGAKAKIRSISTQLLKTNPMVASIEEAIVRKISQLVILKARYTEKHSQVIMTTRELERLQAERDSILKETGDLAQIDIDQLWQLASNVTGPQDDTASRPLLVSQLSSVEKAKSLEIQLQQELNQLNNRYQLLTEKLEKYGGIERQLTELQRDIVTKKEIYNDLLKRYEMAKVTGALGAFEESERVKIIDRPYTPSTPINNSLLLYLIGGIIGGIALGGCTAFLLEISNTRIVRRDIAETILGVTVITRLPNFRTDH